jgi:nitrogen fixation protein NifU and related proteins
MSISLEKTDVSEDIPVAHQSRQFQKHYHFPYHLGLLTHYHGMATAKGSCGDIITTTLRLDDNNMIIDIGQQPQGCAFTIACASAVSVLSVGKSADDALRITPEDVEEELGGLPKDHLHCARLAVNTLGEALESAYRNITHLKSNKE